MIPDVASIIVVTGTVATFAELRKECFEIALYVVIKMTRIDVSPVKVFIRE